MSKYLISVDIEGITGVVSKEFSKEGGNLYPLACRYMINDVNAVVNGVLDIDPDAEIFVRDAHGAKASNLNLVMLHKKAKLTQGWDAPQNMLTGLTAEFSGVFLVGYHAGGQNIDAVLGHTMHSIVKEVRVNGGLVNETGLFALYAGFYDVPIVMVSGDDHTINEAHDQLGSDVIGVVVKKSYGRGCAESLSLFHAGKLLREGAGLAVTKLKKSEFKPFKPENPVTLTVKFYDTGVRVSVFRHLSKIFEFDGFYKFDLVAGSLSFTCNDVVEMMQRWGLILYVIYGIQGSN